MLSAALRRRGSGRLGTSIDTSVATHQPSKPWNQVLCPVLLLNPSNVVSQGSAAVELILGFGRRGPLSNRLVATRNLIDEADGLNNGETRAAGRASSLAE